MALQVELKPGERVFIGDSLITNPQERIRIYVGGDAPILRERDVLLFEDAVTPARRIYFALQMMYLEKTPSAARGDFLTLLRDFLEACPSASDKLASISYQVLMGNMYKAMKETKALIEYEDYLLAGPAKLQIA